MTESIYKEYRNKYYNPNDNDKRPGDNDNWKSIQKGFHDISTTQLETSAGLTIGKGTEDETSVTAAELKEIKDPTQLETSGGLTLGKGTEDEVNVTPAKLGELVNVQIPVIIHGEDRAFSATSGMGTLGNETKYEITGLKPNTNYIVEVIPSFSVYGIVGSVNNHIRSSVSSDSGTIVIPKNYAVSFEVNIVNMTNSTVNGTMFITLIIYESN